MQLHPWRSFFRGNADLFINQHVANQNCCCCCILCCLVAEQARLVGSNTLPAVDVTVQPLVEGGYGCKYIAPATAGLYVLEVTTLDGRHLRGSPFSTRASVLPMLHMTRFSNFAFANAAPLFPLAAKALHPSCPAIFAAGDLIKE